MFLTFQQRCHLYMYTLNDTIDSILDSSFYSPRRNRFDCCVFTLLRFIETSSLLRSMNELKRKMPGFYYCIWKCHQHSIFPISHNIPIAKIHQKSSTRKHNVKQNECLNCIYVILKKKNTQQFVADSFYFYCVIFFPCSSRSSIQLVWLRYFVH